MVDSSPPTNNICDFTDPNNVAILDQEAGKYTFMSRESKTFPPGTYGIQIEVTRNYRGRIVSETLALDLTLDSPCPPNRIILDDSPFRDDTYYLGDHEKAQVFSPEELYTLDPPLDCGPVKIEFVNSDRTPVNADLFGL